MQVVHKKQETLHTVNVNDGRKKEVKEFKNDSTLRPVFHFKLHSCWTKYNISYKMLMFFSKKKYSGKYFFYFCLKFI